MNNIYCGKDIVKEALDEIEAEQIGNDVFHMDQIEYWLEMKNLPDILRNMMLLRELYKIEYYRPLRSNRKVIGRFLIFVRRILRKLNRFYAEPMATDQTNFNSRVLQVLDLYKDELLRKEGQIHELQKQIDDLNYQKTLPLEI
ncbi:MAG: hypothetical protein FWH17_11615 [Oscillospiraceae bacterium]|nr:hypothetical protein [Oscillospiraceae bacterium]